MEPRRRQGPIGLLLLCVCWLLEDPIIIVPLGIVLAVAAWLWHAYFGSGPLWWCRV